MALVCISFSHLGIQLVSDSIHFHESCHSFDSLKYCIVRCRIVFFLVKSMLPSLRSCRLMFKRETVLRVYTCNQNNICVSNLSQSYGYIIYNIPKLFSKFHVIDVGLIMALLRQDYSCRHQLIPGISLKKKISTLRSVCLNDRFSCSRHRFTSLTFDQ